jgi:signal transduction histidine kinase
LRSPLGGIITATEALQEVLAETDPAAAPLMASSLSSAEELSRLIKRFSFVVKATAQPRPSQALNMGEAVSVALERLHPQILKQGAVVREPSAWPEVNGVLVWLEIIWWNLLTNALEHSGTSPTIELGWRNEQGKPEFWVADHGQGVPASKRSTLFQPFHTLHESNAPRGLGLPIVQRLVELQGGYCGYKPGGDGGACFYFGLP